jgi:hypothetical protein
VQVRTRFPPGPIRVSAGEVFGLGTTDCSARCGFARAIPRAVRGLRLSSTTGPSATSTSPTVRGVACWSHSATLPSSLGFASTPSRARSLDPMEWILPRSRSTRRLAETASGTHRAPPEAWARSRLGELARSHRSSHCRHSSGGSAGEASITTLASCAKEKPRQHCRGADELFRGGVLDPRDRALDQALAAQPRLVSRRGLVIGTENPRPQRPPTEEAR